MKKLLIAIIGLLLTINAAFAQNQPDTLHQKQPKEKKMIDQIVAVVTTRPILESDLVDPDYPDAYKSANMDTKCRTLENLVLKNLLINKAELDSLVVDDSEVDQEIDRKVSLMIGRAGSIEKLEEIYHKPISAFKAEERVPVKETLMAEKAKDKVIENIKITPSEVKEFYNKIPKDSIPKIGVVYELAHIVIEPAVNPDELTDARNKIKQLRDRILNGENFSVLARLYSDDPGSAMKGGELGFFIRGTMAPEFEAAAFSLKKKGDVSEIIKTSFGYHIIQLIERKGDKVNVRHILVTPKVSSVELDKAGNKLDSLANLIRKDSLKFDVAARKFSTDKSFVNNGEMINPATLTSKFTENDLDPTIFAILDKLKVGEVSGPLPMDTEDRRKAYQVITVKSKSNPHVATLNTDYDLFQNMALMAKKNDAINKWAKEKIKTTYIKVNKEYQNCDFYKRWF
ncbi:MAG: peptidylprolyl isomerase [Bacteroidota bacterium]|nr:peptidylprolyl isomerase [Bacteroidota bacterium]